MIYDSRGAECSNGEQNEIWDFTEVCKGAHET